jgi:hypothetical protein
MNGIERFRIAWKGFVCHVMVKAFAPWFNSLNQALAPMMSVEVGKFPTAAMNLALGRMEI